MKGIHGTRRIGKLKILEAGMLWLAAPFCHQCATTEPTTGASPKSICKKVFGIQLIGGTDPSNPMTKASADMESIEFKSLGLFNESCWRQTKYSTG